ncbi:hypothetical protein, partial [Herbaspirillum sp. NPDC087042]|uniref:hypothetical protein n=1 Tax=Herbaspirillum sp. NPDC087042 TaxID=3364004 RepID=UPI0037F95CA9
DMRGRMTGWLPSAGNGRWVKWRGSNLRANQQQIRLLLARIRENAKSLGASEAPLIPLTAIVPDVFDPRMGFRVVKPEVAAVLLKVRTGAASFYSLSRMATIFDIFIEASLLQQSLQHSQSSFMSAG